MSSVVPFFSCPQSFPASGSFPMSQLFVSSGQSIGVSASVSSPSNEYSGLISFRMDWLGLLAVQGTLKSLLQYHSSKASILQHSAFFPVQLSHPYMTTGKTIALTRWTFDFSGGSDSKASVYNAGDPGTIPGWGRPSEEGNGNPLQYYCLENPIDRGAC